MPVADAGHIIKKQKGPDPILVKDQLAMLQATWKLWGAPAWMKFFIWLLTKQSDPRLLKRKAGNSRLVPFEYNPIQLDVEKRMTNRNIILKARQVGMTTWVLKRRIFVPAILEPGTNGYLISQSTEKAIEHFKMVQRAYANFGALDPSDSAKNTLTRSLHENLLHRKISNRKEMIFDQLDSSLLIGSAEVSESGQGSTLHHAACSEVARWPGDPDETLSNLKEAIPLNGTLDLESTANGAGGYFFEECARAENNISEFTLHFHTWWWEPKYRIELSEAQAEEMEADLASDELILREKYHLDLQQIAFRRNKQKSLRHNFEEKYPEDPRTCFLISGATFFDKDIVRLRLLELELYKPLGEVAGGDAKIFKKPVLGKRYIIGADVASGKFITSETSDLSAAKVLDLDTGEEVAMYMARIGTVDFAQDLVQLARTYNKASIAVERGGGPEATEGGTVLLTMRQEGYGNVFQYAELYKAPAGHQKQVMKLPGMPTNAKTRPVMLNKLKDMFENNPELFWDVTLVRQMASFVRNEKGRPGGSTGTHDDMVMASAIGHLARLITLGLWDPLTAQRERYGQTEEEE